jgi:hypothetical protein
MVIGGSMPAGGPAAMGGPNAAPPNLIIVLRATVPLSAEKVQSGAKKQDPNLTFTETKVGRFTVYEGKSSNKSGPAASQAFSFALVDSKRMVAGPSAVLRSVLDRDKAPKFSDNMQAALKQMDSKATIAFAADAKDIASKAAAPGGPGGPMPGGPGGPGRPGGPGGPGPGGPGGRPGPGGPGGPGGPMPGGPGGGDQTFNKVNAVVGSINVGADVDVTMTAICQDDKAATEFRDTIQKNLDEGKKSLDQSLKDLSGLMGKDLPPGGADVIKDLINIQVTASGPNLTFSKTIKVAPIIQVSKEMMKQANGKPPGVR